MESPIRVFFVEDHPATVNGIRRTLEQSLQTRFEWAGDASNAADALHQISAFPPDIVLLDLGLPAQNHQSGIELLQRLRTFFPQVSVVIFSASASLATAADCIAKGAVGYLCKTISADRIVQFLVQAYREPKLKFVYIDDPEEQAAPAAEVFSPLEKWITRGVLEEKSNDELTRHLLANYHRFREEFSRSLLQQLDEFDRDPTNDALYRDLLDDAKNFIINRLAKNIYPKAKAGNRVGLILYALKWNFFPDFTYQRPALAIPSKPRPDATPKVRLMIVEDHKATLAGLKADLNESGLIEVVATAENGLEAERYIFEHPDSMDVVLTDYKMPVMDGLELIKKIKLRHPHLKMVMLSVDNAVKVALHALGGGAVQYLVKDSSIEEIERAVVQSVKQAAHLSHIALENGALLSPDDLAVLSGVLNGESAAQIAQKRKETPVQVETSIRRLKEIFGAKSLEGLAIAAYFALLKSRR